MDPYLILATAFGLIGLWNLMIAVLGLFPKCRATAVGTLTSTNTRKNFRNRSGLFIPIQTRYTYIYTVNGKQYRYRARGQHSKRRLFPKVTMVYVKGFPRFAYPNKFTGAIQWILAIIIILFECQILFALQ